MTPDAIKQTNPIRKVDREDLKRWIEEAADIARLTGEQKTALRHIAETADKVARGTTQFPINHNRRLEWCSCPARRAELPDTEPVRRFMYKFDALTALPTEFANVLEVQ